MKQYQYYPDPYNYYGTAMAYTFLWVLIPIIFWLCIGSVCAFLVYKDAKKKPRMNAPAWALIAFVLPIIGMLIYFIIKNAK